MARVNAQQWLQKWGNNLQNSGQYITAGVQRVTTAPGQLAAAAQDRYVAGVQLAASSGKWAAKVSAVSLSAWQDSMIKKGLPRIATGVQQAQATKQAAITTLLSNVDAAAANANSLPKGGLAQGIARATAFMTSMHQAYQKG